MISNHKEVLPQNIKTISYRNIKYIKKLDLMQNAFLDFYARNHLEKTESNSIRTVFEDIDRNGDGVVEFDELKELFRSIGKEEETKKVFNLMDFYKTNQITYEDFMKGLINRKNLMNHENMNKIYQSIDLDKKGNIEIEEFKTISLMLKDPKNEKKFKQTFYKYSNGKHYVSLTRSISKISITSWILYAKLSFYNYLVSHLINWVCFMSVIIILIWT